MRKWNLTDVALLDGKEPAVRPPYKNRGEAARLRREQVQTPSSEVAVPKHYTGIIFLCSHETGLSGAKRLGATWRLYLSEAAWEQVGVIGGHLRLFDTETGTESRVRVVSACLTRSPKRLEVQLTTQGETAPLESAPLLPVHKVAAK